MKLVMKHSRDGTYYTATVLESLLSVVLCYLWAGEAFTLEEGGGEQEAERALCEEEGDPTCDGEEGNETKTRGHYCHYWTLCVVSCSDRERNVDYQRVCSMYWLTSVMCTHWRV